MKRHLASRPSGCTVPCTDMFIYTLAKINHPVDVNDLNILSVLQNDNWQNMNMNHTSFFFKKIFIYISDMLKLKYVCQSYALCFYGFLIYLPYPHIVKISLISIL